MSRNTGKVGQQQKGEGVKELFLVLVSSATVETLMTHAVYKHNEHSLCITFLHAFFW